MRTGTLARVRPLEDKDIPRWIELRAALWPEQPAEQLESEGRCMIEAEPPLVVFVAENEGALVGFLEMSLRSYAEGCVGSPVPYVEGWYVEEKWRGQGIGAGLMHAAEQWSRANGYTELGSDALEMNSLSRGIHLALGFDEVETLVIFRKQL